LRKIEKKIGRKKERTFASLGRHGSRQHRLKRDSPIQILVEKGEISFFNGGFQLLVIGNSLPLFKKGEERGRRRSKVSISDVEIRLSPRTHKDIS